MRKSTLVIFEKLAAVVLPPSYVKLWPDLSKALGQFVDSFPRETRLALEAGLLAFDSGAVLKYGRRFRKLDHRTGKRYVRAWQESPVNVSWMFIQNTTGLLRFVCYEHEKVHKELGYTAKEWMKSSVQKRLTVYKDDIEIRAEKILESDPLPGLLQGGSST